MLADAGHAATPASPSSIPSKPPTRRCGCWGVESLPGAAVGLSSPDPPPAVRGAAVRSLLRSRPSGEAESVRPRCRLLSAASRGRNARARVASPLQTKLGWRRRVWLWASGYLLPPPHWVPPPPRSIFPEYFIMAHLLLCFSSPYELTNTSLVLLLLLLKRHCGLCTDQVVSSPALALPGFEGVSACLHWGSGCPVVGCLLAEFVLAIV